MFGILSELVLSTLLGVLTRLIQPLQPNLQPHLPAAHPVSTYEALTTESQRDNCYISVEEMPAHTESVQRLLR
jgi:hypothetical protein